MTNKRSKSMANLKKARFSKENMVRLSQNPTESEL